MVDLSNDIILRPTPAMGKKILVMEELRGTNIHLHARIVPLCLLTILCNQIKFTASRTASANMGDYTFKGWMAYGPDSVEGKMRWEEMKPKNWTEDDIDIEVSHSGICGVSYICRPSGCSYID